MLERLSNAVAELPQERRAALESTLQSDQRAELERFRSALSPEAYCTGPDEDGTRLMLALTLEKGLEDWAYHPERLERLAHADASTTIEALDEVQLVVESILSDEWENWGRFPRSPPKPEQSVLVSSVYGGTTALRDQTQSFEDEHGLKRFEGAWWYVDPGESKG